VTRGRSLAGFFFLLSLACASALAVPSNAKQTSANQQASSKFPNGIPSSATAHSPSMTPAEREETRGDIFMARKMYNQAIQTYQDVLLSRGMPIQDQQKKRGFFQRLFGVFGLAREPQDPKNSELLDKIGIAYQQLGDMQQAQTYYRRSAESNRHFSSPLNNLGTIEFGRKRYKGAVKWYTKAIRVDPHQATTFSNMGYAYLAWNKYQPAILAFRQAILLDPAIFQDRGDSGSVVEEGGGSNPGLYYYTLAKTFALLGNADRCAHFLKMSRDEGYKKFTDALKDPAFRSVLKDPRVMAILAPQRSIRPTPHSVPR
jgi:tetratricopeptide (TPR) repeat protein